MTSPYTNAPTNTNKCQHGFPVGACPMCSGIGGVPKDKNKARKPGEMSYNECMAEWHRIQARQKAEVAEKQENQKDFLLQVFSDKLSVVLEKIKNLTNDFEQNIESLPKIVKTPVKIVLNFIQKTVNLVSNAFKNMFNFIQNSIRNLNNLITNAAEKIPTILFEIKNFISLNMQKIFFTPVKTILTLFVEKDTKEQDKKDKQKRKVKKILEKIFGLYFREDNENK